MSLKVKQFSTPSTDIIKDSNAFNINIFLPDYLLGKIFFHTVTVRKFQAEMQTLADVCLKWHDIINNPKFCIFDYLR